MEEAAKTCIHADRHEIGEGIQSDEGKNALYIKDQERPAQ